MKINYRKISEGLWDYVFPRDIYCICCGNIIDQSRSYGLCDHCMLHIRWTLEEPRRIGDVDFFRCVKYGIYERSIVFAFKYNNHKYICRNLGEIMKDRLIAGLETNSWNCDWRDGEGISRLREKACIVPVPLHPSKLRRRGFNQAELMGRFLGKETGIPVYDALRRVRDTRPMRGLKAEERKRNIEGAIEVKKWYADLLENKEIILVDDFYTLGNTALECRRALREAKVDSVKMLAFAAR